MFGPETSPPLPWSDEQVAALNRYQDSGQFHPFTCGSGNRSDAAHIAARERFNLHDNGQLVATRTGWICPACDYRQEWAHAAMFTRPQDAGVTARELEPFANYHGDLPDYDHPLRCVYESGIQYAVELLAKMLRVEDYDVCDGTEEFDGDLGGTLLNIVLAAMPKNADGDPYYPEELTAALSRPALPGEASEGMAIALLGALPFSTSRRITITAARNALEAALAAPRLDGGEPSGMAEGGGE